MNIDHNKLRAHFRVRMLKVLIPHMVEREVRKRENQGIEVSEDDLLNIARDMCDRVIESWNRTDGKA